jgi:hypothetical protein
MFQFSSMPMMPMSFPPVQPTAEQTAEMERIALQYQQQQLIQLQQRVAQYSKSIEDTLAQIEEALTKKPGDKAIASAAAQANVLGQDLGQNQSQNQATNQLQQQSLRSNPLRYDPQRYDPQRFDPQRFDPQRASDLQGPQSYFQGGLGDFGRPVF